MVENCDAVGPSSMSFEPKLSDVGERVTDVSVPVPSSAIETPGEFDVICTDADLSPTVWGSKLARTVQWSPGASEVPALQSSDWSVGCEKSVASGPPRTTALMSTVVLPELVT